MTAEPLETYLATVDPPLAPAVVELHGVVRDAYPGFDVAIKYHMLTYAIAGDWHTWVCAIQATGKGLHLRFLYGVLLDDPLRVLRAGTSVLKTWDLGRPTEAAPLDSVGVSAYVAEAARRYPEYKANAAEVLATARATGRRSG